MTEFSEKILVMVDWMSRVLRQRESRSRSGRLRDLLEGSLTRTVAPPMRATGWWSKRWNQEGRWGRRGCRGGEIEQWGRNCSKLWGLRRWRRKRRQRCRGGQGWLGIRWGHIAGGFQWRCCCCWGEEERIGIVWRSGSNNRRKVLNRLWVRDLGLLCFILI